MWFVIMSSILILLFQVKFLWSCSLGGVSHKLPMKVYPQEEFPTYFRKSIYLLKYQTVFTRGFPISIRKFPRKNIRNSGPATERSRKIIAIWETACFRKSWEMKCSPHITPTFTPRTRNGSSGGSGHKFTSKNTVI